MKKIIFLICILFMVSCRDNEPKLYPNERHYLNDTNDNEFIIIIIDGNIFFI
jgi:hypothetical protein